jgi:hypothetical protein
MKVETANTGLLQRTLSRAFPNKTLLTLVEGLILLMLGMIAIALHARLRVPLHLPGRQGLLFLTVIMFGRLASKIPFAATISMFGSASLLLPNILGFNDPFMPYTYMVLGVIIDVAYLLTSMKVQRLWIIATISAICWMLIPLMRLAISIFSDFPFQSFRSGFVYPFATHLLFGFLGGLLGYSIFRLAFRKA